MSRYVLSQLFVILSMICIGSTYICKDKKTILFLCILYGVFYGGHYLLLNAITGFFMNGVGIVRNIWFYRNAKKNQKNSKLLFSFLILLGIGMGMLSYQDAFSFISIGASCLSTYSVWQDKVKVYRLLAIPISIGFILYGIHVQSFFAIISEVILLTVEVIGVMDYYHKNKKISLVEENI